MKIKQIHIRIVSSICIIGYYLSSYGAFAATEEAPIVVPSYKEYQANAKAQCEAPEKPWTQNTTVLPIPQYPELSSEAVNHQIEQIQSLDKFPIEEKNRITKELSNNALGSFEGFKTVEVARVQYRSTMNSIFACGVTESKLRILQKTQDIVAGRFPSSQSEIQEILKKEKTKLLTLKDTLKCNNAPTDKTSAMREVLNSSTKQYCYYRYYLGYVQSNLDANRAAIERYERNIGTPNNTTSVTTLQGWVDSYNSYKNTIDSEIARADSTLPKAFGAYRDLELAYPAHLMLMIIYDDYIRLRKNLSSYMNASTQLYLKAYNAQDVNKK